MRTIVPILLAFSLAGFVSVELVEVPVRAGEITDVQAVLAVDMYAETITVSPPGWIGHHWDYDWLPPEDE